MAQGVACIGALAKGLRQHFASAAKSFVPVLLEKQKDKSQGVWRNCNTALATMHKCVSTDRPCTRIDPALGSTQYLDLPSAQQTVSFVYSSQ